MVKQKVLIVEDEGIIAFHIKKLLEGYGYEVAGIASTAEEAITKTTETIPDLVLMDITLKGDKDGVYAAGEITRNFNSPIIFLTANTDEKTLQKAKLIEPYGFINKPFQGRELKTNIEIALYTHKMRRKLFESEQLLSATLGSINEGVIATNSKGIIKFVNAKACDLTGYKETDLLDKNITDGYIVIEDTSNEALICNMAGILAGKPIEELFSNKILVRSDGTQIPVEEEITKIQGFNQKVSGNVVVFKDISKTREIQIELIQSRNYYLALFDALPALVWQTNPNGEFNYFNNTWLEFRAKDLEEEVGAKWIADIHPDDRDVFIQRFTYAREQKRVFHSEFRILNKKEGYDWLICVASPFNGIKKSYAGYLGVCQNITGLKKIENALIESKVKAETANEAKSRFISVMSHELRTPMNGILGMIELLKKSEINNEQKNYLRILSQGAYTLLNTINSILDLSKTDAGKYKLEEKEFNIHKLLYGIIESYNILTDVKDVDLNCNIDKNIPEVILGDAGKIKQILTNILNNAVKFTNRGKIEITLSIDKPEQDAGNPDLLFCVSDTGIGIHEEKLKLIFESFKQADDSHTREYGGVGLGLSISKQLTELLGGKIWVESEINKGSKFFISLKLKTVKENVTI